MSNRSYNHYCGLSYALDVIGERWSMLIVRELVAGPRRFKDLMAGLPGISTNLLTERLKGLEQKGILARRTLPPPAGSTVYALTPLGHSLEPTLLELGKWGSRFVPPTWEDACLLGVGSYALTLKTFFRPELARHVQATYELRIDNEVMHVRIDQGTLEVRQGENLPSHVVVYTQMPVYIRLLTRALSPGAAIDQGLVRLEHNQTGLDDMDALAQFIDICGLPIAPQPSESAVPTQSLPAA